MLQKLLTIGQAIGKTSLLSLPKQNVNLFIKMEAMNFTGSVKVWPAFYILKCAIEEGLVTEHTTIVESTSGNFGLALAILCKHLGLRFVPVIDPNINPVYEKQLRLFCEDVEKVTERDESGGFLLTRLQRVQELLAQNEDSFWTNQYGNPHSYEGHYHGVGRELAESFENLEYVFLGVSSGGTVTGISRRLKEAFPHIKVIAVDSVGSVIFGGAPQKRYIPGIGSSMVPPILEHALIDEVVMVPEIEAVEKCHELMQMGLFAGGSTGSSYAAVETYFKDKSFARPVNVAMLMPDGGAAYLDTVYNEQWVEKLKEHSASFSFAGKSPV